MIRFLIALALTFGFAGSASATTTNPAVLSFLEALPGVYSIWDLGTPANGGTDLMGHTNATCVGTCLQSQAMGTTYVAGYTPNGSAHSNYWSYTGQPSPSGTTNNTTWGGVFTTSYSGSSANIVWNNATVVFYIYVDGGGHLCIGWNGQYAYRCTTPAYNDGNPHTWAIAMQGGGFPTANVFVDGAYVQQFPQNGDGPANTIAPMALGSEISGSNVSFQGTLGLMYVANTNMSAAAAAAIDACIRTLACGPGTCPTIASYTNVLCFNFDSYTNGSPLPAPWSSSGNNQITSGDFWSAYQSLIMDSNSNTTYSLSPTFTSGAIYLKHKGIDGQVFDSIGFTTTASQNVFVQLIHSGSGTMSAQILGTGGGLTGTATISDGVWQDLLLKVDAGSASFSVNGTVVLSCTCTTTSPPAPFNKIFLSQINGTNFPSDYKDNLGVYSLSPPQSGQVVNFFSAANDNVPRRYGRAQGTR